MTISLTPRPPGDDPIPTDRYVRLLVVTSALLLLLFAGYIGLRVLTLIHHTVLLFSLGGLFAYALDPIVEKVRGNRTRPRWLGVVTVFIVLISAVGAGTYFLGRETVHQVSVFSRDRDQIQAHAREKLTEADAWLQQRGIPINLSDVADHPPENVRKWGEAVAQGSLRVVTELSRSLIEGIVVLLITVYFLLFSEEMRAASTRATPARLRPYLSQWQDDVNRILGGFVRGQAVLALVLGAAAAAACAVLGLKFWLLIGVFVVFASLIPVVGPYIGALPAILSAVLTPSGFLGPGLRVAVVVILFFIINEIGSKVLYPRLVGRALGLHEILVLFALLAGFEIGGIVGVLFAAPLTALGIVTLTQIWRIWMNEPPLAVDAVAEESGEEAAP